MAHWDKLYALGNAPMRTIRPKCALPTAFYRMNVNVCCCADAAARLSRLGQAGQNHLPAWQQAAEGWAAELATQPAADRKLANFIQDKLKIAFIFLTTLFDWKHTNENGTRITLRKRIYGGQRPDGGAENRIRSKAAAAQPK